MKRNDPGNGPPDDAGDADDDDGEDDSLDWWRSPLQAFGTGILPVLRRRRHRRLLPDSGRAGRPFWMAETASWAP